MTKMPFPPLERVMEDSAKNPPWSVTFGRADRSAKGARQAAIGTSRTHFTGTMQGGFDGEDPAATPAGHRGELASAKPDDRRFRREAIRSDPFQGGGKTLR
jgi:hypothetical protein